MQHKHLLELVTAGVTVYRADGTTTATACDPDDEQYRGFSLRLDGYSGGLIFDVLAPNEAAFPVAGAGVPAPADQQRLIREQLAEAARQRLISLGVKAEDIVIAADFKAIQLKPAGVVQLQKKFAEKEVPTPEKTAASKQLQHISDLLTKDKAKAQAAVQALLLQPKNDLFTFQKGPDGAFDICVQQRFSPPMAEILRAALQHQLQVAIGKPIGTLGNFPQESGPEIKVLRCNAEEYNALKACAKIPKPASDKPTEEVEVALSKGRVSLFSTKAMTKIEEAVKANPSLTLESDNPKAATVNSSKVTIKLKPAEGASGAATEKAIILDQRTNQMSAEETDAQILSTMAQLFKAAGQVNTVLIQSDTNDVVELTAFAQALIAEGLDFEVKSSSGHPAVKRSDIVQQLNPGEAKQVREIRESLKPERLRDKSILPPPPSRPTPGSAPAA